MVVIVWTPNGAFDAQLLSLCSLCGYFFYKIFLTHNSFRELVLLTMERKTCTPLVTYMLVNVSEPTNKILCF